MRERPKLKELTWTRTAYSYGPTWNTDEWTCDQYPDLRCRVHSQVDTSAQFHQFMLRGDHGTRHASLKKAYRALMNRKAIRIGYAKRKRATKINSRRGARSPRRISRRA